jgi:hypothetical protein
LRNVLLRLLSRCKPLPPQWAIASDMPYLGTVVALSSINSVLSCILISLFFVGVALMLLDDLAAEQLFGRLQPDAHLADVLLPYW